jgi:hypothetical protein
MLFSSRGSFGYGLIGGALLSAIGTGVVAMAYQDRNVLVPMYVESAIALLGGAIAATEGRSSQRPNRPKTGAPDGPTLK